MTEFDDLIAQLRKLVDERQRAGHRLIDQFVENLTAPAMPTIKNASRQHEQNGKTGQADGEKTNVDKVLDSIANKAKTVKEIAKETSLDESQVRGVLYSKGVESKLKKEKVAKKMTYRLESD